MGKLVYRFQRKPYGWYLAAIQCLVAQLLARGKVEAERDSNYFEDNELLSALRNTHGFDNLILQPLEGPSPPEIAKLKRFYGDFFDKPPIANEFKALGQETVAAFKELSRQLDVLSIQAQAYPFASRLQTAREQIASVGNKPYMFYYNQFTGMHEDLFNLKEQVLDPIRRFLGGSRKTIYDEARRLLNEQGPNFAYVAGDEDQELQALLADPQCYSGPQMQQAKPLADALRAKTADLVQREKSSAKAKIDEKWKYFIEMAQFAKLTAGQQAELAGEFETIKANIDRQNLIDVIRGNLLRFNEQTLPNLTDRMVRWTQVEPVIHDGHISLRSLQLDFNKFMLENEDDARQYLQALEKALLKAIAEGKRVQL